VSYCRWSSDFGECDVYVYADVSGGWTTHVAGRKLKHLMPDAIKAMYPSWNEPDAADRYMAFHKAEQEWRDSLPHDEHPCMVYDPETKQKKPSTTKWVKDSEYADLPEPYGGESYNDPSPGECAERLEDLRKAGLRVPQYAIDALREEQAEMTKAFA
jgi:hypothetical protein